MEGTEGGPRVEATPGPGPGATPGPGPRPRPIARGLRARHEEEDGAEFEKTGPNPPSKVKAETGSLGARG